MAKEPASFMDEIMPARQGWRKSRRVSWTKLCRLARDGERAGEFHGRNYAECAGYYPLQGSCTITRHYRTKSPAPAALAQVYYPEERGGCRLARDMVPQQAGRRKNRQHTGNVQFSVFTHLNERTLK